jgi:hypothetical protein
MDYFDLGITTENLPIPTYSTGKRKPTHVLSMKWCEGPFCNDKNSYNNSRSRTWGFRLWIAHPKNGTGELFSQCQKCILERWIQRRGNEYDNEGEYRRRKKIEAFGHNLQMNGTAPSKITKEVAAVLADVGDLQTILAHIEEDKKCPDGGESDLDMDDSDDSTDSFEYLKF